MSEPQNQLHGAMAPPRSDRWGPSGGGSLWAAPDPSVFRNEQPPSQQNNNAMQLQAQQAPPAPQPALLALLQTIAHRQVGQQAPLAGVQSLSEPPTQQALPPQLAQNFAAQAPTPNVHFRQNQLRMPSQMQSQLPPSPSSPNGLTARLLQLLRGRTGSPRNQEPVATSSPVELAAAILKAAGELPAARRHELLEAAAAHPSFSPLFKPSAPPVPAQPDASAPADQGPNAAPAPANVPFAAASYAAPYMPRVEPVSDVEGKLKELAKAVRKGGPAAAAVSQSPPKPAGKGAAAQPQQQDKAAAGAQGAGGAGGLRDALSLEVVPEYEQYGVVEGEVVRAVVSIKAAAATTDRAHVALTCVLDRSGSMSGERIELVKETCHFLIDQLTENDYLGLVSYATSTSTDLPLVRMTAAAKALAHIVTEAMYASGSTALYDGLVAGVRQQMASEKELAGGRVVHSCFLFTDGEATDGPKTAPDIISGLRGVQRGGSRGQQVTVHTFGFGQNHSVELLQAIAEEQGGVYYFIRDVDDIAGGFGDALGGLLSVVAKDVRVSIAPAPGTALTAFRSGGRVASSAAAPVPLRRRPGSAGPSPSPGSASVPTSTTYNEIFAEESREALVVLGLPAGLAAIREEAEDAAAGAGGAPEGQVDWVVVGTATLEYVDVASGCAVTRSAVLRVARSPVPRAPSTPPAELVLLTALRFETIDAIEAAQRLAAEGPGDDVGPARTMLDSHLARLMSAQQGSGRQSAQLGVLSEQTRVARDSIRPRYQSTQEGVAQMMGSVQMLKQQRAASSSEAAMSSASALYQNASKDMYRKRATQAVKASYVSRLSGSAQPY